ncbi:hypothetical protein E4K66_24175 [Bradyrhizobium frederickii]|uniref:Uncharacterized protein n=1 Tax=Bradyrhizobium frederickii TaxID=2560054 RepID=A0A4Y9L3I5_9BRAD|nr:hypothetical protein [Bradyrhizobium frederickii]TFV36392.1 hypothetical protein E4K66_24175 [Bradyrhizobium frederickii]
MADATSVFDAGAPILIPAASVSGLPNSQLTPEQSVPPQVDAEKLSAAARADSSPAMPMGARDEQLLGEARDRTLTWLGVALMMLGSFSILSASRALRHALRLRH